MCIRDSVENDPRARRSGRGIPSIGYGRLLPLPGPLRGVQRRLFGIASRSLSVVERRDDWTPRKFLDGADDVGRFGRLGPHWYRVVSFANGVASRAGRTQPAGRRLIVPVSYTHLRAHETGRNIVCRL